MAITSDSCIIIDLFIFRQEQKKKLVIVLLFSQLLFQNTSFIVAYFEYLSLASFEICNIVG